MIIIFNVFVSFALHRKLLAIYSSRKTLRLFSIIPYNTVFDFYPLNDNTVPTIPIKTPNIPIAAAGIVSFVRLVCNFKNIMMG